MKRGDVVRYIESRGCVIQREGTRHTIFVNPENGRRPALSRQREINNDFVRVICRQLGIDPAGRD